MAEHHHGRLDLGVVVRVVAREQRDAAPVQRLEARRRVGDPLAGDARDDPGEQPDPDAPRPRRAVAAFLGGEARADGDVGLAAQHGLEDPRELRRIVLPVAVDADGEVEAVLEGEAEARLHGAADAEVERQPEDDRALRRRDLGRAVDGAVVDDDDDEPGIERAQLVDHARHRQLLVQRGDDRDAAQLREPGERRGRSGACSTVSGTGGHRHADTEQLEQLPRAVRVRVLVEHALARAAAHLLRLRGIGEQLPVRRGRLVRVRDDDSPPGPARTTARSPRADSRRPLRRRTRARTRGTSTTRRPTRARGGSGSG